MMFLTYVTIKEINMESLGRELTAAEREEIQRRSELLMARDMFGIAIKLSCTSFP